MAAEGAARVSRAPADGKKVTRQRATRVRRIIFVAVVYHQPPARRIGRPWTTRGARSREPGELLDESAWARRARVGPVRETRARGWLVGPKNNSDASDDRDIALGRHGISRSRLIAGGGNLSRETGDKNRHLRTLMCFTFRAARVSRSESCASREREPSWHPITLAREKIGYELIFLTVCLIILRGCSHTLPAVTNCFSFLFILQ